MESNGNRKLRAAARLGFFAMTAMQRLFQTMFTTTSTTASPTCASTGIARNFFSGARIFRNMVAALIPTAPEGINTRRTGNGRTSPVSPAASFSPWSDSWRRSGMSNPRNGISGGAFISSTYTHRAGVRSYKLYIPGSYYGQSLPLVVMLHGCKQDPNDFAAGTRMNEVAEEFPCFVVYPAQDFSANASRCWNWFEAAHQLRGQGEPSIIAGITRAVIRAYPIDTRRVYVAGLSAGGAMAAVMGATYPDMYAAACIHSGLAYALAYDVASALELMKQGRLPLDTRVDGRIGTAKQTPRVVPTIVFHGEEDNRVHPRNCDHLIAPWMNSRASVKHDRVRDGHAYTHEIYHDTKGRPILEHWKIHGAGHAWSGGSSRGSYTDPKGPDATREMIRFFKDHPRRPGRALLRWIPSGP